jgi:hypothetical protein
MGSVVDGMSADRQTDVSFLYEIFQGKEIYLKYNSY